MCRMRPRRLSPDGGMLRRKQEAKTTRAQESGFFFSLRRVTMQAPRLNMGWGLSLFMLLVSACQTITSVAPAHPSPVSGPAVVYSGLHPWPTGTHTPTPWQPLRPTGTWLPTPTFTPTLTPSPTPTPTPSLSALYAHRINILLLGSDQRPGEWGFRTDIILLVSYNPATGATSLISFPRDLYVEIPGVGFNRINTAMFYGGFDTLAATLEQHFGIRPAYYVLIRRGQFKALIDTLGGLEVHTATRYCDTYTDGSWRCVGPGTVFMDADVALWYVRARKHSNDLDRNRRQHEILRAIAARLLSADGLRRLPELYHQMRHFVTETNISWQDVWDWLPALQKADLQRVYSFPMTATHVRPWITPGGAQVLLPNGPAIEALLRHAAQP